MLFHANDLGMLCLQFRPVLIVLELAPLTLRKLKDDKKTREIQNLRKIILTPPPPPNPGGGKGGLSKMAQVPEGVYLPICGINYGTRALLQEEVVYEVYRKVKVADL